MTPGLLREALAAHAPDQDWPYEPAELLAAVERLADSRPGDPVCTRLVLAAHDLASPAPSLPRDLRPRELVRVDGFSSTWLALDVDGIAHLVRCTRPDAHPVHRRILERDWRALSGHVPGLLIEEGALIAPAPGTPLIEAYINGSDAVSLLGDSFRRLAAWKEAGIGPGDPARQELRMVDGRLLLVVLTPNTSNNTQLLRRVVSAIPPLADGPIAHFVEGLKTLDPATGSAEVVFKRTLSEALREQAVDLRRRSLRAGQDDRRGRLQRAVERLFNALPPPDGSGPVGFDLNGQPTRVESREGKVQWGAEPLQILFADGRFQAPLARRFLRACATAPALSNQDQQMTDSIGRWVSAGLKLRTVRLLLEKS